jgi:hypothetical protein
MIVSPKADRIQLEQRIKKPTAVVVPHIQNRPTVFPVACVPR